MTESAQTQKPRQTATTASRRAADRSRHVRPCRVPAERICNGQPISVSAGMVFAGWNGGKSTSTTVGDSGRQSATIGDCRLRAATGGDGRRQTTTGENGRRRTMTDGGRRRTTCGGGRRQPVAGCGWRWRPPQRAACDRRERAAAEGSSRGSGRPATVSAVRRGRRAAAQAAASPLPGTCPSLFSHSIVSHLCPYPARQGTLLALRPRSWCWTTVVMGCAPPSGGSSLCGGPAGPQRRREGGAHAWLRGCRRRVWRGRRRHCAATGFAVSQPWAT